ncbi:putative thiol oxidoreductase [Myxococcus hansupus]|uniref:Putative thiol oxidoreductase n=1 Tax=Pseudomyxococcus hansupus TaxID=1297742 RepID=A0A0H4WTI7_9BACT|nr:di-heme oxidoredictase family protein [Myxococcus hansupus]AKQ64878.1 putative thiol oxidoreductase [Myxococcus hansupus]
MKGRLFLLGISVGAVVLIAVWANTNRLPPPLELGALAARLEPGEELSGGATSVPDPGRNAFGRSPMNMARERWPEFHAGKRIFDRDWTDVDGPVHVGPLFIAPSCMTCHVKDGRGQPPASPKETPVSLAFQLSGPEGHGVHPRYGAQLDVRHLDGKSAEGTVEVRYDEVTGRFSSGEAYALLRPRYTFAALSKGPLEDGVRFSPRVAPVNFGLGLLEAIPEAALLANEDPEDRNQDGISGRANRVMTVEDGQTRLGRFGWKANQPTLRQQVAQALSADMGLTTTVFPLGQGQEAPSGDAVPEVTPEDLEKLVFYTRLVAAPKRRDWDAPTTLRGKAVFEAIGCASCHLATPFETEEVPGFPEVSRQKIYPYSDLLLHDMGDGLADGRPDGLASGTEWRTPPLWGIGLVKAVNGHTRFLHDGRARNLEEAVLWHGGEAALAQERYTRLPLTDRQALLTFLESL